MHASAETAFPTISSVLSEPFGRIVSIGSLKWKHESLSQRSVACFLLYSGSMRSSRSWSHQASGQLVLAAMLAGTSGCALVGDVFKAGFWVAVIGIGILALVTVGIVNLVWNRSR
jgi:hypothetical protein